MHKTIILNNIEYVIMGTVEIDGSTYVLLTNINDERDFCFRKIIIKNNKAFYSNLDSREEFEKVLVKFTEKMLED